MIFVGALSSNIFYTKVKPEQLSYDPYLSNNGLRMSQADSTFTYSQDTSDSTLILTPYTMIASSVSTLSLSIQQVSSLDSDISFNWGSISSLSIYSNSIASILVDLSCSISGASDISYTLQSSNSQVVPSWVTLNAINRLINVNATNITAGTTLQLIISSTSSLSQSIWNKAINIGIINCYVVNWLKWSQDNANTWIEWIRGYNLNQSSVSNSWLIVSNTSSNANEK